VNPNEAVIVSALRTPVGKAFKGSFVGTRPEELGTALIQETLKRHKELNPLEIDDVILGCAFPEGVQGLNLARIVALQAGLPDSVPAYTVNRLCASSLQAIVNAVLEIQSGQAEIVLAGGIEMMSYGSLPGIAFLPSPELIQKRPQVFLPMGLTAENVAAQYNISRTEQDEFACRSHQRACNAINQGAFIAEIVPIHVKHKLVIDGKLQEKSFIVSQDEGPRSDTTLETLSRLKPVFKEGGSVTAGNSSQMSDGAAMILVMSAHKAQQLGIKPLARLVAYAVGGVAPEVMGIGPTQAIPKVLQKAKLTLNDIDLIELNEAFAAQALAVIKLLKLDLEKVNVNGGAIALGHPLGATGAKLTTQLLHEMNRRQARYGIVTMCIGIGMGAAAIFENIS